MEATVKRVIACLGVMFFASVISVGQVQFALDYDGIDDYVLVPDDPTLEGMAQLTLEAWIKPVEEGSVEGIISKRVNSNNQSSYSLFVYNDNRVYFKVNNEGNTFSTATVLTTNRWYHIAAVFDGSLPEAERKKIYVNGSLDNTGASTSTSIASTASDFHIGVLIGNNTSFFSGQIDEVRVWNSARTNNQIRNNCHRELPNPNVGVLAAYYVFNQTSGILVPDVSNNSNNGTLMNMDPATDWVSSTAPIPYFTVQNGWWLDHATWAAGQRAPVNNWARVRIDHDVEVNSAELCRSLIVSMSGCVTIDAGYSLTVTDGGLVNQAGTSGIIIDADVTGMGSLIFPTSTIEGTLRQYVEEEQWHFVSSPVTSAVSNVYLNLYLIEWSEPDSTWSYIVPITVPLNVTQGYGVWASHALTGTTTVSYSGVFNAGDQTVPLSFSNNPGEGHGWNLIGNPFQSAVEWNTSWTSSSVDATIYVWNGVQYLTWNRNTLLGTKGNGMIPVSQGFFVKANAPAPTLVIPESARLHSAEMFYKSGSPNTTPDIITLNVNGNGYGDQLIIHLTPEATLEFDHAFDAYKIKGIPQAPQLYASTSSGDLTVNAVHKLGSVDIGLETGTPGIYSIRRTAMTLPGNLYLEDFQDEITVELNEDNLYEFFSAPDDPPLRFRLHYTESKESPASDETLFSDCKNWHAYSSGRDIVLELTGTDRKDVTIFNALGQVIHHIGDADGTEHISVEQSGVYVIRINAGGNTRTSKIMVY
ncbi:MAG: T9SS type A sorting domain-containing protein [Bacteroidales bacterium]|nr:T9SS type A sorting domain-containing protein [Bacteroidales bacterium]